MNKEFRESGYPRILVDHPIEALVAIVLRHLGGGYLAPDRRNIDRYPQLCIDWLEDFRHTFQDPDIYPIRTAFRANPFTKGGRELDGPREGEANYPLFAMWRKTNDWKQFTVQADSNRVTVEWAWILPPHEDVERNWPILTHFDFNLRRCIDGIKQSKEDRDLLKAAGVADICREKWVTEQGFKGPANRAIFPTLTGSFDFQYYWQRTEYTLGLDLPAFNRLYAEYFLLSRREDGTIVETRLNPRLSQMVPMTVQGDAPP